MKMSRVPIRVFETEPALAEIDLAGNASVDHPLERPVHGRPAGRVTFRLEDVDQIISAQMPLLPQEDVDDQLALAGPSASRGAEAFEVVRLRFHLGSRTKLWQRPSGIIPGGPPRARGVAVFSLLAARRRTTGRTRRSSSRWGS